MKSARNRIVFVLVGTLFASAGLNAYQLFAAPRAGAGDIPSAPKAGLGGKDPCISCALAGVRLSDEQRRRLLECGARARTEEAALDREIGETLEALKRELKNERPDRSRAYAFAADVSRLRDERLRLRVESILEVKDTLTREQLLRSGLETRRSKPEGDRK